MEKQDIGFSSAFVLVGIFMLLLVMTTMLITPILIYFIFTNTKVFGDYGTMLSGVGSVIGCVLSFFSICLVLITIKQQQKAMNEVRVQYIMESRQKKLMELQHMLIDSINNLYIKREVISKYCDYQINEFHGIECFEYFNNEVYNIESFISTNNYKEFSETDLFGEINDLCQNFSESLGNAQNGNDIEEPLRNWKKTIEHENAKFSMHYYGIDKKRFDDLSPLKGDELKREIIYICEKKHRNRFATYLRCLITISKFLDKIKKEDFYNGFYKECRIMIVSQFSMEEEYFVKNIVQKYSNLNVLLNVADD